jgi:hypothetical protein
MGFLSRQPGSDEIPRSTAGKSPWLCETELVDEFVLRLQGKVKRCGGDCHRPTHIQYLDDSGRCPDCRPR